MPQFPLLIEITIPIFEEQSKFPWSKVLCDYVRAAPQSKKDPGTGSEETFYPLPEITALGITANLLIS